MVGKEAIPEGDVFESVTMRQYIARLHWTLYMSIVCNPLEVKNS
jgi:hypothetical protein